MILPGLFDFQVGQMWTLIEWCKMRLMFLRIIISDLLDQLHTLSTFILIFPHRHNTVQYIVECPKSEVTATANTTLRPAQMIANRPFKRSPPISSRKCS